MVRKRLINFNLCKSCCIQTHFFWFSMASCRYVDKSSLRREEKGKKKLASLCTQLIWNAQKRWNSFKRSHLSLPLFPYSRWRRRRRRLQRRSFGLDFKHLTSYLALAAGGCVFILLSSSLSRLFRELLATRALSPPKTEAIKLKVMLLMLLLVVGALVMLPEINKSTGSKSIFEKKC